MEQFQQKRQETIQEVNASLTDAPPEESQQGISLDDLEREFLQFIDQFLVRMVQYQGFTGDLAKMSELQISQIWDSAAAVRMAIIKSSKEVKALRAEQQ